MPVFEPVYPKGIYPEKFETESEFVNTYNAEIARLSSEDPSRRLLENGERIYGSFINGKICNVRVNALYNILFSGCVIDTGERNYIDDSDFFAIIWNPDTKTVFTHDYGSTRYAGSGYAKIDLTLDNRKAAEETYYQWLFESYILSAQEEHQHPKFTFGCAATIIKKHKPRQQAVIEAGSQVEVEKEIDGNFGMSYLVRLEDGRKVIIPKHKIEFSPRNPLEYDFDEVVESAHRYANHRKTNLRAMCFFKK